MAKIFVVLESHTFQNNKCKKFIQKIVPYGTIKIAFVLIFFFKPKKRLRFLTKPPLKFSQNYELFYSVDIARNALDSPECRMPIDVSLDRVPNLVFK